MSTLRRTRLKGWYEFYRETCVICNKRGGCMINEEGDTVVCIRVESDIRFSEKLLSWVHHLNKKRKPSSDDISGEYIQGHEKKPADALHNVHQALLDNTSLTDAHYEHLKSSSRQMDDHEIMTRSYRSFPNKPWETVKILSEQFSNEDFQGVPGFFENKYGWTISGAKGIMIPYRNEKNQIVGFQIRVDNPLNDVEINRVSVTNIKLTARVVEQPNVVEILIDNEVVERVKLNVGQTHAVYNNGVGFVKLVRGQRYFWLSSANKNNGTGAGNPMPIHVAVPTKKLKAWKTGEIKKAKSVWVTEGALKADIAVEHISKVYHDSELQKLGSTFLATAGVNTWRSLLPSLEEMGVNHVNLAFDMDMLENPDVAYHLKTFAHELKKRSYSANLVMWNPDDGKGIDDVLINHRTPTFKKLF